QSSSILSMSQYQLQTTNLNYKSTTSISSGANMDHHNKSHSGMKGFSFFKGHHQHNNETSSPLDHNSSIPSQKGSKQSSKNKPSKHDHTPLPSSHIDSENHHLNPMSSRYHHAHTHTQRAQTDKSGVASFKAIFQCQSNRFDERIILEEWLQKRSSSLQLVWKRRWCVLRDGCFYYYRSNTDTKPLGVLHLADYSILSYGHEVSRKSKFVFRLSSVEPMPNENQHHLFHAETAQALDLWLDAIQGHINHALAHLNGDFLNPLGMESTWGLPGPGKRSDSMCSLLQHPPEEQEQERNIIDEVLERLQLEDPTLSDINDPSTLIMPVQEHPSSPSYPASQHLLQRSFQEMQLSFDDNLDGWGPFSTPSLTNRLNIDTNCGVNNLSSSSTSLSVDHPLLVYDAKQSIGLPLSPQRSPIATHNEDRIHSSDVPTSHSGSYTQSKASSYTDSPPAHSSFSEIGILTGNSGTISSSSKMVTIITSKKGLAPYHPITDSYHQGGGEVRAQMDRGNQGQGGRHPTSPSFSEEQSSCQYSNSSIGTPQSPLICPYRINGQGQSILLEIGGIPPSSSNPGSPLGSPRLSYMKSTPSSRDNTIATPSRIPFSMAIEADTTPSHKRTQSEASSVSISTIDSITGDMDATNDARISETVSEIGYAKPTIHHDQKKSSNGSNDNHAQSSNCSLTNHIDGREISTSRSYCTDNDYDDLCYLPSVDEEGNSPTAASVLASANPKKAKKLWSVYGGSGSESRKAEKASNGSKRAVSQALDADNPMLKNLVLISPPSKKSSPSRKSDNGKKHNKVFSKSMTCLPNEPTSMGHYSVDTRPTGAGPHSAAPSSLASSPRALASRARSPSVSILDEAYQLASIDYSQKRVILMHRQNGSASADPSAAFESSFIQQSGQKLPIPYQGQRQQQHGLQFRPSRASTAPIHTIKNDWGTHVQDQRFYSQPQRCIAPALIRQQHHSQPAQVTGDANGAILRHIIAPDELALAIDLEMEESRRKQEIERLGKLQEQEQQKCNDQESKLIESELLPSGSQDTTASIIASTTIAADDTIVSDVISLNSLTILAATNSELPPTSTAVAEPISGNCDLILAAVRPLGQLNDVGKSDVPSPLSRSLPPPKRSLRRQPSIITGPEGSAQPSLHRATMVSQASQASRVSYISMPKLDASLLEDESFHIFEDGPTETTTITRRDDHMAILEFAKGDNAGDGPEDLMAIEASVATAMTDSATTTLMDSITTLAMNRNELSRDGSSAALSPVSPVSPASLVSIDSPPILPRRSPFRGIVATNTSPVSSL
ncbi:Pleckstrin y domain-containing A member 4, partial [Lobosporangium transversale]